MAIEFKLIKDPDSTIYESVRIASQAYAVGDAVMTDLTSDSIDVVPATASTITARIHGVAMEAKTASDTSLLIALVTPRQRWGADVTNTANASHNYQRMVLTDKGTVNNTGSDVTSTAAIFQQTGIGPGSTRVVGRFLAGYATT